MRPRRKSKGGIYALYTVAELAEVMNRSERTVGRILEAAGVQYIRSGRSVEVPLSEIESKLPILWESIKTALTLRRAG
jgi:excisionase family DNA binding protein